MDAHADFQSLLSPGRWPRLLVPVLLCLPGPRLQAELIVTPGEGRVVQGTPLQFKASRNGQDAPGCVWSVVEAGGGTIEPGGRYLAPRVPWPRRFHVRAVASGQPMEEVVVPVQVFPALAQIENGNRAVGSGATTAFTAIRGDAQPPAWVWEVVEPNGGIITGAGVYQAPWVANPSFFHIRVKDTAHPAEAVTEVRVLPPGLVVTPSPQVVVANGISELVATRVDGQQPATQWIVNPVPYETSGTTPGPASIQFRAPHVAAPTTLKVLARQIVAGHFQSGVATLRILPRIELKANRPFLFSGQEGELRASRRDQGNPPNWAWNLPGRGLGALRPGDAAGSAFYRAPEVAAPTTVVVEVADTANPPDRAWTAIDVLPAVPPLAPGKADLIFGTLMPNVMGRDWTRPSASWFGGTVDAPDELCPSAPWAQGICSIARVARDPAAGALAGAWLVADGHGIHALSPAGEASLLVPVQGVTALAACPRNRQAHTPIAVFAQQLGSHHNCNRICALDADGGIQVLAGRDKDHAPVASLQDGAGLNTVVGLVSGLALAPDGTIFMVEKRNRAIRMISPLPPHAVRTLPGYISEPKAVAVDPATGILYVSAAGSIYQCSRQGQPSLLLGGGNASGWTPPSFPEGGPVAAGVACLYRAHDLAVHGRNLYILDTGRRAILAFNLDTRVLHTLVGPAKPGAQPRVGPLRCFTPDLPEEACAGLGSDYKQWFAMGDDGQALVGWRSGLMHLDLAAPEPGTQASASSASSSSSSSTSSAGSGAGKQESKAENDMAD